MFTLSKKLKGNAKFKNWSGLKSPKVTSNVIIQQIAYDFLFDFNRNYASILYHFCVIERYLSEVTNFNYPTCIWRPRSNFTEIFGIRKLESTGCRVALLARSSVSHFGNVTTDGWMDRWTHDDGQYRVSIASCGKNWGGVEIRGHPRSPTMSPFDRAHMTSYLTLTETMHLFCTTFELQQVIC